MTLPRMPRGPIDLNDVAMVRRVLFWKRANVVIASINAVLAALVLVATVLMAMRVRELEQRVMALEAIATHLHGGDPHPVVRKKELST